MTVAGDAASSAGAGSDVGLVDDPNSRPRSVLPNIGSVAGAPAAFQLGLGSGLGLGLGLGSGLGCCIQMAQTLH